MPEVAGITGAFLTESALRGRRPPLRLDDGARGWGVLERRGEVLVLDEFGDLWWARRSGPGARAIRACWPEEARAHLAQIARALAALAG